MIIAIFHQKYEKVLKSTQDVPKLLIIVLGLGYQGLQYASSKVYRKSHFLDSMGPLLVGLKKDSLKSIIDKV